MKSCNECGDKHYAKGKCKLHYKMPSQLNPKPIQSKPNKAVQSTKPSKPINKVSDKQSRLNKAYSVLRKEYMKARPLCEVKLEGCTGISTDIHHLYFGADRSKHFLDDSSWKAICRSCHSTVHDKLSNEQLLELGLRLKE